MLALDGSVTELIVLRHPDASAAKLIVLRGSCDSRDLSRVTVSATPKRGLDWIPSRD
jgi:hypothetical protein